MKRLHGQRLIVCVPDSEACQLFTHDSRDNNDGRNVAAPSSQERPRLSACRGRKRHLPSSDWKWLQQPGNLSTDCIALWYTNITMEHHHFLMGELDLFFNGYVKLPEGISDALPPCMTCPRNCNNSCSHPGNQGLPSDLEILYAHSFTNHSHHA